MMPATNATADTEDEILEFKPNFTLKEKIGKDVSIGEILNTENVRDSQQVIDNTRKDFVKWVRNDVSNLESFYDQAALDPDNALPFVVDIQKTAFSIKAQSGTFGYDLASAIAKSLYDFCENNYVVGDAKHILVIRKHIDTLNVIFRKDVKGDGGKLGQAVYSALGKLIAHFDHPDA